MSNRQKNKSVIRLGIRSSTGIWVRKRLPFYPNRESKRQSQHETGKPSRTAMVRTTVAGHLLEDVSAIARVHGCKVWAGGHAASLEASVGRPTGDEIRCVPRKIFENWGKHIVFRFPCPLIALAYALVISPAGKRLAATNQTFSTTGASSCPASPPSPRWF